MFDAGSAIGKLGLDVSGYLQGMLQAQTVASLFPATVTNFLANPLLGFVGLLKEATSALTSFFVDGFKEATGRADKINDLATSLGVATEFLSGMELVAKSAGAGLEDVASGMKFLQKNIADLEAGEDSAAKRFAQLGLSAGDLVGKGTEKQFLLVGEALKGLESAAGRTNLSMELLGKGGNTLIPMFAQGTEEINKQMETLRGYGALVSSTSAASADAWGDMVDELGNAWLGFKQMIAEPIRDALLPYMREVLQYVRTHGPEIKQIAKDLADAAVSACRAVADALKLVLDNINAVKGAAGGLLGGALIGGALGGVPGAIIGAGVGAVGGGLVGSMFDEPRGGGETHYIANDNRATININGAGDPRAVADEVMRQQRVQQDRATREQVRGGALMASEAPKFSRVVFQPAGSDVLYDLSVGAAGWILRAGVEPTLNSGLVSAADFQAIGAARTGAVAFYHNVAPGAGGPDVVMRNVTIVNAVPEVWGLDEAGAAAVRAGTAKLHERRRGMVMRLHFADFRHRFVAPRGGMVTRGTLNAKGGPAQYSNGELIQICLEAMGFTAGQYLIDKRVNDVPPPRDLHWLANHAPTELAKVLDQCGAVFCPQSDGRVRIDLVGRGPEPAVSEELLIGRTPLPDFDRRGRTVVMTTGVAGVIKSKTMIGPTSGAAAGTWEFVAQDFVLVPGTKDGFHKDEDGIERMYLGQRYEAWRPLVELSYLNGKTPIEHVRNDFADIEGSDRDNARRQFYRYLRLSPMAQGLIPLRKLYGGKDGIFSDVRIRARAARQDGERRLWSNVDEHVEVFAGLMKHFKEPAEPGKPVLPSVIIEVPDRLLRVDTPNAVDLDASAEELRFGDLEVTVSYYEVVRDGNGKAVLDSKGNQYPQTFNLGFTNEAGEVRELTESELAAALTDPETLIIHRPDQALVDFEGNASNRGELVAEFTRRAPRYMRTDDDPPVHVLAVGFVKCELSGRVAEVVYSQDGVSTTCQVNTWFLPAGTIRLDDWKRLFDAGGAFPGQATHTAERIANGAPESRQPVVPLGSTFAPQAKAAAGPFPAQLTASGGGVYAWTEVEPLFDGTCRAKPNGRTGTLTDNPAREVTGRRGFETSTTIGARTGMRVMLTQGYDPVAKKALCTFESRKVTFDARILGNTRDGGNWAWEYDFVEMRKQGSTRSAWGEQSGGRQGKCWSKTERMNSSTGMTGIGIVTGASGLGTGTFQILPHPSGLDVTMEVIERDDGGIEYWFSQPNGVDGECS